ncbi:DoxX family protein [Actinoplanes sp. NPDC051851]|uniref:DoxX family protein n=1 Tax=Actinoplanes sp. NPDC051851 TaxID=3154753 RepID=UPI00343FEAA7
MHIAYWIVAGLMALLYLFSGGRKATQSRDRLRPMMGWVDQIPLPAIRALGILEILGAIGLILPPLTGVATRLAIAAAAGLLLIQIGAVALHLSRGEARLIGLNVVLLVAAGAAILLY